METQKVSFWEECKKTIQALHILDIALARIETFFVFLLLAFLILAEVAGSLLRELYQSNLAWIEQLLKYVVIWIGMLGASLATQSKEHISIEIVSRFISKRMRRILTVFLSLIATFVAFSLAKASYEYIQDDRRSYLVKAKQSGYLTFENISLYQCPEESNKKRESWDLVSDQAIAYIEWLQQGIAYPEKKQPYPISYLQKQIQSHLEKRESLSKWSLDWLSSQWENQWKKESNQAWERWGKPLWQKEGESFILPQDKIEWQSKWMSQKWHEQGKQNCIQAWQKDGIKEWNDVKEESDLNEEEFQEEWKYQWTRKLWEESWQKEMELAWKEEFGAQECFRKAWQKKWLQKQWQTTWCQEWENILSSHRKIYFKPGNCPCCGQKLIQKPWQVPRWIFLVILPIGFTIIALRFFLHSLESIFLPETLEEHEEVHP